MQDEVTEVHLPTGGRARAVQRARRVVEEARGDHEASPLAKEVAFADYVPRAVRADQSHAPREAPAAGDAVRTIALQLEQLEAQRERLTELLGQLCSEA